MPLPALPTIPPGSATAVFAGGCFWCLQPAFDNEPGVVATRVGYTGGQHPAPTYALISTGQTGHVEAIWVAYDPTQTNYERLLELFWRQIDPTQGDGQFADRGSQYLTAIFVSGPEERRLAEASKAALAASGVFRAPIATTIRDSAAFFVAEEEHQFYYRKRQEHYRAYKEGSGRAPFLRRTWGE